MEKILKEGGGSKAIKKIPEIHPFLKRQASLSEMGSTVLALFKVQGPSLPLTTKLHLNWEIALAPTPKISPTGHVCIPWCMIMETAPVGANMYLSFAKKGYMKLYSAIGILGTLFLVGNQG